jgi:ubiquinone/menaquinone biosynthesis C-methylase UbiE
MIPNWQGSTKRSHIDIIKELLNPKGNQIIDIGCGAGHMTRALTQMGATVIGIDPGKRQLDRAREVEPVGSETYLEAIAEDLPFKNQTIDIALFFNSFHHIPEVGFAIAIEEAHRVLKPGGKLYFAEPIADGPQFELSRLINDETEIRALAYQSILTTPEKGFKRLSEITYITENRHKNFASFKINSTSINPARDAIFEKHDSEIRNIFEELSIKDKGEYVFDHPIRGNLFERL